MSILSDGSICVDHLESALTGDNKRFQTNATQVELNVDNNEIPNSDSGVSGIGFSITSTADFSQAVGLEIRHVEEFCLRSGLQACNTGICCSIGRLLRHEAMLWGSDDYDLIEQKNKDFDSNQDQGELFNANFSKTALVNSINSDTWMPSFSVLETNTRGCQKPASREQGYVLDRGPTYRDDVLWNMSNSLLYSQLSPFISLYNGDDQFSKLRSNITLDIARLMEPSLAQRFRNLRKLETAQTMELARGMQQIADAYSYEALDVEAETWYRRVVTAKQRKLGHKPIETLRACMGVINSVYYQERYADAQNLHEDFNIRLQRLVPAEHELCIRSKTRWCSILGRFRLFRQEEVQRRELVQICIANFGIQHQTTLFALRDLGSCLRDLYATSRGRETQECENIFRTTLWSIQKDEVADSNEWTSKCAVAWDVSLDLARILRNQEKYSEANDVLASTKQRYKELPKEPLKQFEFDLEMAHATYDMSRWEESEVLLRRLLTQQRKASTIGPSWLANTQDLLARNLYKLGQPQEAIFWLRESHKLRVRTHGLLRFDTLDFCWRLAWCYASQRLWVETLVTLTDMIDIIAAEPSRSMVDDHFKQESA